MVAVLAAYRVGQKVSAVGAESHARASADEVAKSLSRGIVWVWPASNGPLPVQHSTSLSLPGPLYREAAVLVESMLIRERHIERSARQQPFPLPANAQLLPVLHVEAASDAPDLITPAQQQVIVQAAVRMAANTRSGLVQLDFEAPKRHRTAYVELVAAIRSALPSQVRLSVTALAHWCTQGDWLDRLAADEVVPMLYRLGPNAENWRAKFMNPKAAGLAQRCHGYALGFATNDAPPAALLQRVVRPYWFDESAWSNPSRPPPHPDPIPTKP